MINKILRLRLKEKVLRFMKENKVVSIASIVFVTFSGINIFLIYNFVQVLEKF
jgi:hypothetical protein